MINFGTGLIHVVLTWQQMRSYLASKKMQLQYEETDTQYTLFAIDERIVYTSIIFKGTVPTVSDTTQGQNDADKSEFETVYKSISNRPSRVDAKVVNIALSLTGTFYGIAIDLDNFNGSGSYKHLGNSSVKITAARISAYKSDVLSEWTLEGGTILSIGPTSSSIGWLSPASLDMRATEISSGELVINTFPMYTDLSCSNGSYDYVVTNNVESNVNVTTSIPLYDGSLTLRTPAVGDVVFRVKKVSGGLLGSSIDAKAIIWYFVE